MSSTKAGVATRRRYAGTFKQEAVRAWKSSGKSAEQVARKLGLRPELLYNWNWTTGAAFLANGEEGPLFPVAVDFSIGLRLILMFEVQSELSMRILIDSGPIPVLPI